MADYIDDYYANGGSGEYDSTKIDFVDNFYANGGSDKFDWTNPNPDINETDLEGIKDLSKNNFGTTIGKIADGILKYGNSFASLLTRIGVIQNPSLKISENNVDIAKAKLALSALAVREKQVTDKIDTTPPPNSTYFGIDFSKPTTWIVGVLIAFGLYKLVTMQPTTADVAVVPKKGK